MKKLLKFLICYFLFFATAYAETELDFAKSTQNPLRVNPVGKRITLPFVNYMNFDYGATGGTQNILDLKPVIPFSITKSFDLVLRAILPLTRQPRNNGYIAGLGDFNPTFFITPAEMTNAFIWGFGPTFLIPTATQGLGAGKWGIGPELVLIAMPAQWTLAILTNNTWSFTGESNKPTVNQFSFQYYITYNFEKGWYITSQPTLVANWLEAPSQRWTVPFGMGFGRAFHIKGQGLNLLLQAYSNTIRPTNAAPWTLEATCEFLFNRL